MASDRHGDSHRIRVVFDANALMMPGQFTVDIFREAEGLVGDFEPVTFTSVQNELEGIARGQGKNASAARVGLALLRRCTVIESGYENLPVDDQLIAYARDHDAIVFTNDRALKDRLRKEDVEVMILRKKNTTELIRG